MTRRSERSNHRSGTPRRPDRVLDGSRGVLYGSVPSVHAASPHDEVRRCIELVDAIRELTARDVLSTEPPLVDRDLATVIIPMWNAERWIEDCLKSVLIQTHRNLEVYCIDDCSTDGSFERVVDLFGKDRRLCIGRLQRRVGPYQIENWIVSTFARAQWVVMQDADDISHPTKLQTQLAWMKRRQYRVGGTAVHQLAEPGIRPGKGVDLGIEWDGKSHGLVHYPTVSMTRERAPLEDPQKRGVCCARQPDVRKGVAVGVWRV
jgi:Glycosyl transferase family 2